MYDLLREAKQFLSIIEESTIKDKEIETLIEAGKLELIRSGIDINYTYDEVTDSYNSLVKTAILFFVKGNFGNVDIKEKEYALKSFNSLEQSLSLSNGYKKESEELWEQSN